MVVKVPCSKHTDCFANNEGYCVCLQSSGFGKRKCPFYKKKERHDRELENIRYTLTEKGRTELIETYHRRKVNAKKR